MNTARKPLVLRGDGWHSIRSNVRVFVDMGAPFVVALNMSGKAKGIDLANAGVRVLTPDQLSHLTLDTWFCVDDSPHAALVGESWGAYDWSGDWMLAEVLSVD